MPFILCERASGKVIAVYRRGPHSFDPATFVEFEHPDMLGDLRDHRWDGAKGLRATSPAEEEAERDEAAQLDEEEALAKPGHMVGALIDLLFNQHTRIAALEGMPPPTRAAFNQALRGAVRKRVRA